MPPPTRRMADKENAPAAAAAGPRLTRSAAKRKRVALGELPALAANAATVHRAPLARPVKPARGAAKAARPGKPVPRPAPAPAAAADAGAERCGSSSPPRAAGAADADRDSSGSTSPPRATAAAADPDRDSSASSSPPPWAAGAGALPPESQPSEPPLPPFHFEIPSPPFRNPVWTHARRRGKEVFCTLHLMRFSPFNY